MVLYLMIKKIAVRNFFMTAMKNAKIRHFDLEINSISRRNAPRARSYREGFYDKYAPV